MKFKTRTKTYEASNVVFEPTKIEAKSYGWYTFVSVHSLTISIDKSSNLMYNIRVHN